MIFKYKPNVYFVGGVGCAATQLAKTVNDVTIIGTASGSKHQDLKKLGVSRVLHHRNYMTQARKVSPEGFDLIVDSIGGPNIEISQSLLKPCGRLVIIGNYNYSNMYNKVCTIKFGLRLVKCLLVHHHSGTKMYVKEFYLYYNFIIIIR